VKKLTFAPIAITLCLAAAVVAGPARAAQNSKPSNPALASAKQQAEADIKIGDLAYKNGNEDEAIADYKAAIEADPGNVDAHTKFIRVTMAKSFAFLTPKKIKAAKKKPTKEQQEAKQKKAEAKRAQMSSKLANKLLVTYDNWIKKNPQQAMFYWGKAQFFEYRNKNADARALLQKAISIDPSCAPAWADLSDLAATDGDVATQRQDAEKALALDPKDDSGVFWNYALTYLSADPAKYRQVVENRAAKYPDGLEYLLDLAAENALTVTQEEVDYEKLYQIYGPKSAKPSDDVTYIMVDLFNLYAKTAPAKALTFAQQMQKDQAAELAKKAAADKQNAAKTKDAKNAKNANAKPPKAFWESVVDFQKTIVDAQSLIAQEKYADAQALLDKSALKPKNDFDPLSGVDQIPYDLTKAQALAGSADNQKAYDTIKTALLPQPDESLKAALVTYGAKLGKSPQQVDQDLWQSRESKAKAMTPFDLKRYVTGKEVKLADFRGQIVLVNFWFPG
jgi:tetratricopeptide (TPR) repeat protein